MAQARTPGRKTFSATLSGVKKRNHEATKAAKVEIRRNVLEAIGPERAHVFDAFAGTGEMFRAVWRDAASCVGCDLDWFPDADPPGERVAFVADNRRVLRCLDLGRFNLFDLDAFGSPWEQAVIIAARRKVAPGERLGLVLTEGSGINMKQGNVSKALQELTGLRARVPGLNRWVDDVYGRALSEVCRRLGAKQVRRWEARGVTGASMRYLGLILEGLPLEERKARPSPQIADTPSPQDAEGGDPLSGLF